jgi:hypothetical protein
MAQVVAYQTKAGRRYRVRYRRPDKRQTDKRGFATKREAELFVATVEVSKARGEYVAPSLGRVTVDGLAGDWLARSGGATGTGGAGGNATILNGASAAIASAGNGGKGPLAPSAAPAATAALRTPMEPGGNGANGGNSSQDLARPRQRRQWR